MSSKFDWLPATIGRGFIQGAVSTWLWPIVLTVGSAALLWLQGLPLGYLAVGTLFAFMCSIWIVLGVSRWNYSRNPEDKVAFDGLYIAADKTGDGKNLDTVQIGLRLKNNAEFPISYRVETIRTTADKTLSAQKNLINMGSVIESGTNSLFRDGPIALKIPKSALDASLEVDILYGRLGNEKYKISKNMDITINYDSKSGQVTYHWFDLPEDGL